MNNYILTSDSYITIVYQTNSYRYNYITTNNTYLHPYEFKTTDSPRPKGISEYIYTDNIDNNLFTPYWKNPNNDGDADGNGASSLNIKAWGVATIKEAAEIGGTTSDSSQLIIKNSLSEYNCQLKDTTTVEYTDNRCVNYIDIEKINTEPDVFIYHIYLNHNSGFITENSNNLIYEKTPESGWDHDEKPQNYNDSIRTDINLTIIGSQYDHIGDIVKPLAPASEGRYYTYDTYTNMYYTYTLYSNNTCIYEWGFNSSKQGSQSGTTENITCFVGIMVPPTGESFDGDAVYSTGAMHLYFEKEYTNATINGKTIKLCLTIN